jgi:hypothetical protein
MNGFLKTKCRLLGLNEEFQVGHEVRLGQVAAPDEKGGLVLTDLAIAYTRQEHPDLAAECPQLLTGRGESACCTSPIRRVR